MKLNNIDLNKLQAFHFVIKYGNLTLASEKLNISKSAVSQSIKSLENQIGTPLFLRKGKKLIPTNGALKLFKKVDEYQTVLLKTVHDLKNEEKNINGVVRIGAYLEFAKTELTEILKSFLVNYPKVQVRLRFDSPTRLKKLLIDDHIDMSFSIFPIKDQKNIKSRKVFKEELVLICKKGMKAKFKNFNDIINYSLIDYFEQNLVFSKWLYIHYKKKPKRIPIKLYAATAEMVLSSVKNGIGIGIIPNYLIDDDVEVISPTKNKLIDYIWLNHFKEQFSSPGHKAFFDFINESMNEKNI